MVVRGKVPVKTTAGQLRTLLVCIDPAKAVKGKSACKLAAKIATSGRSAEERIGGALQAKRITKAQETLYGLYGLSHDLAPAGRAARRHVRPGRRPGRDPGRGELLRDAAGRDQEAGLPLLRAPAGGRQRLAGEGAQLEAEDVVVAAGAPPPPRRTARGYSSIDTGTGPHGGAVPVAGHPDLGQRGDRLVRHDRDAAVRGDRGERPGRRDGLRGDAPRHLEEARPTSSASRSRTTARSATTGRTGATTSTWAPRSCWSRGGSTRRRWPSRRRTRRSGTSPSRASGARTVPRGSRSSPGSASGRSRTSSCTRSSSRTATRAATRRSPGGTRAARTGPPTSSSRTTTRSRRSTADLVKAPLADDLEGAGYEAWPFWMMLEEMSGGTGVLNSIFTQLQTKRPPQAVDAAVSGGLAKQVPEFFFHVYNQSPVGDPDSPIEESYKDWDNWSATPTLPAPTTINLGGLPIRTLNLKIQRPSFPRLSAGAYHRVKLPDDNIREVQFKNCSPGQAGRPRRRADETRRRKLEARRTGRRRRRSRSAATIPTQDVQELIILSTNAGFDSLAPLHAHAQGALGLPAPLQDPPGDDHEYVHGPVGGPVRPGLPAVQRDTRPPRCPSRTCRSSR